MTVCRIQLYSSSVRIPLKATMQTYRHKTRNSAEDIIFIAMELYQKYYAPIETLLISNKLKLFNQARIFSQSEFLLHIKLFTKIY